ncbi:Bug family tripartite tricarboxylate transporter substrate binding protein [Achromobacter ruhlandii]|uniref:Bug family tripartite tricarboxylate transporter substrate binding protein n=2 Tax=Achromobacter ruhlandii TaxID=72557 RepID=UPI0006C2EBE2|nr:tripartite tricarboxylate transporter substrate binding protein [Achromobacter ruhlandii]AMG46647.1 tripartite tricarboxylate transporter substrate binding protein [Achromobacter xylosoxidans]MCZ8398003.1 tripartite tricarboxylate transporter substrate binding protein [Achromobacter ruhlandii]CUI69232.1 Argininosuccinate lyase [Achromobacter ruhlandii]CUJ96196.1 Argininosuccinate lyase [Achromobacter ruhlandii]
MQRFTLNALRGLAALALIHGAAAAQAAGYPAKPIVFIVPYTAGGTTDLVARTAGAKVAEKLGQPVIVENRPGAGGNIGMDAVAKAAPDGYTIGFGAISTNALNPFVYPSMPFDPTKDFTGISMLGASSVVLETGPSLKAGSVKDLVAYAKQHPGTAFGTPGTGTSMHLAGVMFDQLTGAGMQHIPYKGSAQALNDLLGGHLPILFDNLPASLPHIKSGKVHALAVTGSKRAPALPDVPTLAELGYGGAVVDPWFAVYGPARMPPEITAALSEAFQAALAMPDVKDKLEQAGFMPYGSTPAEVERLTRSQYESFKALSQKVKLSAD